MKKALKNLLFETDENKIFIKYKKLVEKSSDTGPLIGSKTSSGEEMFYLFAIPAEGVPIKKMNFDLHNKILSPEPLLGTEYEDKETKTKGPANIHTSIEFIPWAIVDGKKELELFRKKIFNKAKSNQDKVEGLESFFAKQRSRKGTTSIDSNVEQDEDFENITPISHVEMKTGSRKLSSIIASKLGNVEREIKRVISIEDKEAQNKVVKELSKNPLGNLTRDKIRTLSNINIPMKTDGAERLMIKPLSLFPGQDLPQGKEMIDQRSYAIFEKIQMIFFVLEVIAKESEDNTKEREDNTKESEDNTKEREDNTKESEDNTSNESNFYFHSKTILENLKILDESGMTISSTKTAHIPTSLNPVDYYEKRKIKKYSTDQKKVIKTLSNLNLVSIDSSFVDVWGMDYKAKFKLSDDEKDKRLIKANKKVKKLLKNKNYDLNNDPTIKFIFNQEKSIINYKGLKKDARKQIRNSYYSIISCLDEKGSIGLIDSLTLGVRDYIKDVSAGKGSTKNKSISSGITGATLGYNIFVSGGSDWIMRTIAGATPKYMTFFGPLGPAAGLIGIPAFFYMFYKFRWDKKGLALAGKTDFFQTYFSGKEIRNYSKALLEISAKARDIKDDDLPDLYKFKRFWKNANLNESSKQNYKVSISEIDSILEENKLFHHKEALLTRSKEKGEVGSAFKGRKKYGSKKYSLLKKSTEKVIPAILKDLFNITVTGVSLDKDEKAFNKELTIINTLDNKLKENSQEKIDQISFTSGHKGINTGSHFTAYLYSVSKKIKRESWFNDLIVECYSFDSNKKQKVFDIFDEEIENSAKARKLYSIFRENGSLDLLDTVIEQETDGDLDIDQKGVTASRDSLLEIVNNSINIINNISIVDYDSLELHGKITYSSTSPASIDKRIVNKIVKSEYDALSSTLYVILSNSSSININKQSFGSDFYKNGCHWITPGEEKKREDKIHLSVEKNHVVYIENAFRYIHDLFYNDLTAIVDKFINRVIPAAPTPKPHVTPKLVTPNLVPVPDPVKRYRMGLARITNQKEIDDAIAANKKAKADAAAANKKAKDDADDENNKIFSENAKNKADYDAKYLPVISQLKSKMYHDIKIYLLLVVSNSTKCGFKEKANLVNSLFRNDVSRKSKIQALKLAASNRSIVSGIDPLVVDNYIYNKKLSFLID